MLDLTIEYGDCLVVDTNAWLDDRSTVDDDLTASLVAHLTANDHQYADSEGVTEWLGTLGEVSGIYGEDGPVHVATCNEDSFLDNDVSFTFAHAGDHTLIVETGRGHFLHGPEYVEVRTFEGYDDAEAFGYASGWAGHVTVEDHDRCGTEWILESGCCLWRNGGRGDTLPVSDCVLPDENDEPRLVCPDCGGTLAASID